MFQVHSLIVTYFDMIRRLALFFCVVFAPSHLSRGPKVSVCFALGIPICKKGREFGTFDLSSARAVRAGLF